MGKAPVIACWALALVAARCPAATGPVAASITTQMPQWPMAELVRNDCGTRAVAFALTLFGVVTSLADLEALVADRYAGTGGRPTGEGYSLAELKRLLYHHGLQSRGGRLNAVTLRRWSGPAILRLTGNEGGHFVVLMSWSDDGEAIIYDPNRGQFRVPEPELISRWRGVDGQGVALFIQPPEPGEGLPLTTESRQLVPFQAEISDEPGLALGGLRIGYDRRT